MVNASAIYNHDFAERISCSEEDRLECENVIETIVTLSEKARCEGLLFLEDAIVSLPYFLLRKGLELVVDGTEPELVTTILSTHILAEPYRGKELLLRCIIIEGILAIQAGDNPGLVKERLIPFLGEKRSIELLDVKELPDPTVEEMQTRIADFLTENGDRKPVCRASRKLCKKIHLLDNRCIERLLRELDESEMVTFLGGADTVTIKKVLSCMSLRAAHSVAVSIAIRESIPSSKRDRNRKVSSVKYVCRHISNIIRKLEDAAEFPVSANERRFRHLKYKFFRMFGGKS